MTIKTQAFLQGYLHEKTAAPYNISAAPLPLPAPSGPIQDPNIQKYMAPWTGKETATDTFAEEQKADAIAAGNQWPTMTGNILPGRRPDGSLNWSWAKPWGNPVPVIKGIRDTAKGAVADISRAWAGQRAVDNIEGIKDYSVVGDIKDVVKYIRQDPIRNTKQMLKDVVYGPGGAYNLAALALPATWASKIPRVTKGSRLSRAPESAPIKTDRRRTGAYRESTKEDVLPVTDRRRTGAYRESTKEDVLPVRPRDPELPEGKEWGRVDPASVVDDPRRIKQPGGQPVPDAARVPGSVARKQFLDKFVETPLHGIANDILDGGGTPVWSNAHGPDLPNKPQSKGVFYVDAQGVKRFRRHPDDLTEGLEATTGYSGGYIIDNPL